MYSFSFEILFRVQGVDADMMEEDSDRHVVFGSNPVRKVHVSISFSWLCQGHFEL